MPRSARWRPALAVCATLVTLAACDSAPGPAETAPLPRLSALEITPTAFDFQSDAATAEVPLVVRATVDAAATVRAVVRYAETDSLVADVEATVGAGAVELRPTLRLPRGATGDYEVTVVTEGADGRPGDRAAAVFHFQAASLGPPTVSVEAPASVAPGGRLAVVATVADPDGRANIALVQLQDEFGGVIARLFDQGRGRSDDATAGDGRYSETLVLSDNAEPGVIALQVVAFDRAGTASEPAAFTVTVQ